MAGDQDPQVPTSPERGPLSGKGAQSPMSARSSPRVSGLAAVFPCLRDLSGLDVVQDWPSSLTSFQGRQWS